MAATTININDQQYMRAALGLAQRGLGNVAPNPAVGCILVREDLGGGGRIVGRGVTQPGGRPHAETAALEAAGAEAAGSTAYVTLEPCAHHGETPPCAQALIEAKVKRVVVACRDPDPRVDGGGIAALEAAGIAADIGIEGARAQELNAGFFKRLIHGHPLVTVKTATTLDGKIATHTGESQWITGPDARAHGHALRASHDAVLIGSGTARADNPALTCRLPGLEDRSPIRIVVDGRLSTPLTSQLALTAKETPTWIITLRSADADRRAAFAEAGVEIFDVAPDEDGRPDLHAVFDVIGKRGVTRLLVEAGGRLVAGLFRAGLVDRLVWFRAPLIIGGDGQGAIAGLGVDSLGQAPLFRRIETIALGDDVMETYTVEAPAN